jgi:hypothetical protein
MRRGSRLPRRPERPNRGNRASRNVIVALGGAAAGITLQDRFVLQVNDEGLTAQAWRRTSRLPDSRAAAAGGAIPPVEESPGSTGTRCRLTAGGGDPRESATESKPPVQGWPARADRPRG